MKCTGMHTLSDRPMFRPCRLQHPSWHAPDSRRRESLCQATLFPPTHVLSLRILGPARRGGQRGGGERRRRARPSPPRQQRRSLAGWGDRDHRCHRQAHRRHRRHLALGRAGDGHAGWPRPRHRSGRPPHPERHAAGGHRRAAARGAEGDRRRAIADRAGTRTASCSGHWSAHQARPTGLPALPHP